MSRKRFTAEQIIGLLREADVKLSQGKNAGQVSLLGTLSPSSRQILSTRLWLTLKTARLKRAVIRRYPYRPYLLSSRVISVFKHSLSSLTIGLSLWVDLG
jgi:hypothetical protein